MQETNLPTLGMADQICCQKCEGREFYLYRYRGSSTCVFECVKCHRAIKIEVKSSQILASFEFTPSKGEEHV